MTKQVECDITKNIEKEIGHTIDSLLFDIPFKTILENFHKIHVVAAKLGYSNLFLLRDYYGYDGGFSIFIRGFRNETEKEKEARLKREEKIAQDNKKKEDKAKEKRRRQYEKLKEEFQHEAV